jgi:hypothetical protein
MARKAREELRAAAPRVCARLAGACRQPMLVGCTTHSYRCLTVGSVLREYCVLASPYSVLGCGRTALRCTRPLPYSEYSSSSLLLPAALFAPSVSPTPPLPRDRECTVALRAA